MDNNKLNNNQKNLKQNQNDFESIEYENYSNLQISNYTSEVDTTKKYITVDKIGDVSHKNDTVQSNISASFFTKYKENKISPKVSFIFNNDIKSKITYDRDTAIYAYPYLYEFYDEFCLENMNKVKFK
jgi:hypothetical protein